MLLYSIAAGRAYVVLPPNASVDPLQLTRAFVQTHIITLTSALPPVPTTAPTIAGTPSALLMASSSGVLASSSVGGAGLLTSAAAAVNQSAMGSSAGIAGVISPKAAARKFDIVSLAC